MSLSRRRKTKLLFVLFYVLAIFLVFGNAMITRTESDTLAFGNGMVVPTTILQGVIQSFLSAFCVIATCLEYKKGVIYTIIAEGTSMCGMLSAILLHSEYGVIPGIISTIVIIVTVIIISRQLKTILTKSQTDYVTKLPNRTGFAVELEKLIDSKKLGYVAYLEIRNFRSINDTLGREYGNIALRIVAERIKKVVADRGVVSRLGGVEYAVAFTRFVDAKTLCEMIADRIAEKIPLEKDGVVVNSYLNCVIGISVYQKDAHGILELMHNADIAMGYAGHSINTNVVFYNQEIEDAKNRHDEIQRNIVEGLENDYFYLVYQPQYTLNSKKLRGFESLLRMKLPDGTMISPGEFIPIAESTELITQIDNYVFTRALREFAPIVKESKEKLIVSVNVSAKSMASSHFAERVKRMLDEYEYPADQFEIEITEYSFSESPEQTLRNVGELRKMGVMIALDDFGTGYSSMEQLLKLPISLLKIDKSLIDDIENNQRNRDFINTIIYMGHLIDCEVISEGVENEAQLKLLTELNCDFVQGFVYSKPLPYPDACTLVGTGVSDTLK